MTGHPTNAPRSGHEVVVGTRHSGPPGTPFACPSPHSSVGTQACRELLVARLCAIGRCSRPAYTPGEPVLSVLPPAGPWAR